MSPRRRRSSVGEERFEPAPLDGPLLEVVDLKTAFKTPRGLARAVDGVSFSLERGRTLGVVGESGSGKTVLSRSIMGLLPKKNVERSGTAIFEGHDLVAASDDELRGLWGAQLAMVFQDPMTSLNPVMKIGNQLTEMLRQHLDITKDYSKELALALLQSVGIPEAERRLKEYPHQMSGGMRQRVVIAVAIACGPKLLFADEPTTALDVTVQAQILDLLQDQQRERYMAMILVTHDLGVVAGRTDEIAVMYAGRVVEKAPTRTLFSAVRHPYTEALMRSIPKLAAPSHTRLTAIGGRPPDIVNPPPGCKFSPRCPYVIDKCREEEPPLSDAAEHGHAFRCWIPVGTPENRAALEANVQAGLESAIALGGRLMAGSGTAHLRPADQTLLRIEDLVVEFPVGRTGLKVHAVTKVSIDVLPGETLGLVGESGCGKSTMGKAVMQLVSTKSGTVTFEGNDLTHLRGELLRALRPKLQMIFQDPISSLNPRRRVRDIVREGLDIWKIGDKASRAARVDEVLDTVGIDPSVAGPKRPHEFSGGQCQRISIARAVATEPKLIICDEPVSALDVSVQAQILNLLEEMKKKYGLTLIFIAHDLAVVKNVSDRVAVMYLGKLCEFAQPDELYAHPAHPYTAALLSAIPEPDPNAEVAALAGVGGEIPSPLSPPSGCRFRTRCPNAEDRCASEEPLMREIRPAHFVACHFPLGEAAMPASAAPTSAEAVPPITSDTPAAAAGSLASVASPEPPPSAPPMPPVAPVVAAPPPPTPSVEPPRLADSAPIAPAAAGLAAGAGLVAAAGRRDEPGRATAPPAERREPDDAWLRATTAAAADTSRRAADPAPDPEPEVVSPPVAAPDAVAASDAPAPTEAVVPSEPEPDAIPDVASLDTLLPDRTTGGSINPGQ